MGPGLTETPMIGAEATKMVPKKSLAQPDQIASVIAMICSKDGSFINGETFILHGGFPRL